mmetsp:Transcript_60286/g.118578  ORF Transcript_60286/g.118578 Transcript_60286/m.118578 type:complete len:216 (-) Transcript_60286:102-749(-)
MRRRPAQRAPSARAAQSFPALPRRRAATCSHRPALSSHQPHTSPPNAGRRHRSDCRRLCAVATSTPSSATLARLTSDTHFSKRLRSTPPWPLPQLRRSWRHSCHGHRRTCCWRRRRISCRSHPPAPRPTQCRTSTSPRNRRNRRTPSSAGRGRRAASTPARSFSGAWRCSSACSARPRTRPRIRRCCPAKTSTRRRSLRSRLRRKCAASRAQPCP